MTPGEQIDTLHIATHIFFPREQEHRSPHTHPFSCFQSIIHYSFLSYREKKELCSVRSMLYYVSAESGAGSTKKQAVCVPPVVYLTKKGRKRLAAFLLPREQRIIRSRTAKPFGCFRSIFFTIHHPISRKDSPPRASLSLLLCQRFCVSVIPKMSNVLCVRSHASIPRHYYVVFQWPPRELT